MSIFGSFDIRPGILQRSTGLVDLITRHRQGTTALRLWSSNSIEDAYGTLVGSGLAGSGGTNILEADAGVVAQTVGFAKRGWSIPECRRGNTSFQYTPEDIGVSDDYFTYVRLQEQRLGVWVAVPAGLVNQGYALRGPILIVPPTYFLSSSAAVLSLQSVAPLLTGCVAGLPPVFDSTVQTPLPLHIQFPKPAATVTVKNLSEDGDSLLVCYGLGMPMMDIAAGDSTVPTGGGYAQPGVREIIVAAMADASGAVPFSIDATIGMELR